MTETKNHIQPIADPEIVDEADDGEESDEYDLEEEEDEEAASFEVEEEEEDDGEGEDDVGLTAQGSSLTAMLLAGRVRASRRAPDLHLTYGPFI
ncbi:hypothetical protein EIP91_003675 [Steccherinum ochraceum]|uniref:Uncharacterized protein n=1 Tax=Steccherinum ochraceum TaxID=92696 RepID=A0A4R0RDG8_9APHY|nr:hypothetical protein EIP91_003675 [Steccherinum ochraceum]